MEKNIGYVQFDLNDDLTFSMDNFRDKLNEDVGLVSVPHVSHITGVEFPIKEIARATHEHGALLLVDGAQAASSRTIDVRDLDVDFYAFSGHKMFGPSGTGCLYGKKELLEKCPPFMIGGETVTDTQMDSFLLAQLPNKYEAGLQNYSGAMGLRAAVEYIEKVGIKNIHENNMALNSMLSDEFANDQHLTIIGPRQPELRSGIFNFYIKGVDSLMISKILNKSKNIMVRHGKHCSHSWYNEHKIPETVRVSFSIYNTPEEVKVLIKEIKTTLKYYRK